jgi:electron transfer flavoprotein alpha subunit
MTVLCLLELDEGGAADASLRALGVAGALARTGDEDLAAAWFGPAGAISGSDLFWMGVATAHAIWATGPPGPASAGGPGYAPLAWARALAWLAHAEGMSAVVAAATDRGNEVLAHLGAITGQPMAANCVDAARTAPGQWRLTRLRWAGSLLEDAVLDAEHALLTVAADAVPALDVVPAPSSAGATEPAGPPDAPAVPVLTHEPELADGDLVVQASESAERTAGVSLATARVVIGGGRGVGSPEGFAALEELAELLGAAVGVSRVVTSQGWRPHRQQVGQTGTKITADLYLACGISGAIQHMAGAAGAKTIVAINTDPGAPIMAKADYAIVGDLHEVIPALIAAIRSRAD